MRTALITTFYIMVISIAAFAQQPGNGKRFERIHAIKVGYLTDRLHLNSSQSARFWPIYDRYDNEFHSIRRNFFQKYRNSNPRAADDATARQLIDDDLDYQQDIIELKRKYNNEFLTVLTPQQLATLYKCEREFKEMLLRQLKERHGEGHEHGHERD